MDTRRCSISPLGCHRMWKQKSANGLSFHASSHCCCLGGLLVPGAQHGCGLTESSHFSHLSVLVPLPSSEQLQSKAAVFPKSFYHPWVTWPPSAGPHESAVGPSSGVQWLLPSVPRLVPRAAIILFSGLWQIVICWASFMSFNSTLVQEIN